MGNLSSRSSLDLVDGNLVRVGFSCRRDLTILVYGREVPTAMGHTCVLALATTFTAVVCDFGIGVIFRGINV